MLAPIISDPAFYAVAIPAVIFLGLAKAAFPALRPGATPLLALYLPPLEAAALLLPIVLCQDAISVHAYWRQWSGWNLKILLPGAVFGLVLGYLFAAHVSDDTIRILIGLTALIFVATTWLGPARPKPAQSGIVSGLFWGTVSGFLSFAQPRRRTTFPGFCAAATVVENDFRRHHGDLLCRAEHHRDRAMRYAGAVYGKECLNLSRSPAAGSVREPWWNLAHQGRADGTVLSRYLCFAVCSRISPVLPGHRTHAARNEPL